MIYIVVCNVMYDEKSYNFAKIVNVADVWIEKPGEIDTAEQHGLGEHKHAGSIDNRYGAQIPSSIA